MKSRYGEQAKVIHLEVDGPPAPFDAKEKHCGGRPYFGVDLCATRMRGWTHHVVWDVMMQCNHCDGGLGQGLRLGLGLA